LLELALVFIFLELAPALSFNIYLSTQISWLSFTIHRATHHVHGRILCGLKVKVFKLRSTILHQIKPYTLLATVTTVVLWSCRHHLLCLRTTPHWSVACTRQQRFHVCRRVLALLPLSTFIRFHRWCFLVDFDAPDHGEAFLCWRVDYMRHHSRLPSLTIHCVVVFWFFFFVGFILSLCFYIAGLDLCACSWPGKHRYFEVIRSSVFQLRSINLSGLSTMHSIPSNSWLVPLQSTVSCFFFRYSRARACTPRNRV